MTFRYPKHPHSTTFTAASTSDSLSDSPSPQPLQSTTLTTTSLALAQATGTQTSPQNVQLAQSSPSDSDDDSFDPRLLPSALQRSDSGSSLTARSPSPSPSPPTVQLSFRARHSSPPRTLNYSRPLSVGGVPNMPPMQRAHSSPGVDSTGRFVAPTHSVPQRPSSPLTVGRRRSPLRYHMDESFPTSWSGLNIEPNIPEHAELELSGRESMLEHGSPMPSYGNTFPRPRRRPASPLHASASSPALFGGTRSSSPGLLQTTSATAWPGKFAGELYPSYSFSSASSVPSTPTSLRSRSPSISSLDTIEDTPDAEEAAEEEQKEDKDRRDDPDTTGEMRRRGSNEMRERTLRSNKERKRWSVCGAERRADFSLEPIEE